jgi:hypothetical protein
MAENGDGPHKTVPEVPVGRPFAPGHDARRNAGGRPRGLAAAARDALGNDGHDLIAFFSAVMRGDRAFLGERRPIALRDRMEAARWLADRAYGKPPQTVTIADLEQEQREKTMAVLQGARELPEHLKDQIRAWFTERRERHLTEQRETAERRMLSFMPDRNGDGLGDSPAAARLGPRDSIRSAAEHRTGTPGLPSPRTPD